MSTEFNKVFPAIREHAGKPVFVHLSGDDSPLKAGKHALTVFDWSCLDDESKGLLVECQLMALATEQGPGWTRKLVPFALVDGESHPVPPDELDQQCSGVLLLDLGHGEGSDCPVVLCKEPSMSILLPVADSLSKLEISE